MRAGSRLVLVWVSKWTWLLCGWSKMIWFQCRHWNCVGVYVAGQSDLLLMPRSKLTLFWCRGIEMDLTLAWESTLTWFRRLGRNSWFLLEGSNFTWFQRGDRNWLVICVRAENDFFSCGDRLTWFFLWVEIDWFLVCGPEISWFQFEHRTELGCRVDSRDWFDFSGGIEIGLVFVWQSKITCCKCLSRN